ncbi:hypothetical protein AGOR_G00181380 [Albula goreensis]|uniref:MICOS complex subunit MIC19 n=1 Tax=Albula goreensis TaxID=1534307 RepID=A0A8T3CWR3_9TELE|nr:hypothetical protein AGOR_G00181380 [Albula goreensis]
MGGNNSTRRVSFESDENDNITIVKGIRLSENVINRMREAPIVEPIAPPNTEPIIPPPPPVETVAPPSPLAEIAAIETEVAPASPPPVALPEPPASADIFSPPPLPPVDEEDLRRKITDELKKGLEQERSEREVEMLRRLEEEKAQVLAQAETRVQDEVGKILTLERAANQESIKEAVLKERMTVEEERLRAQLYELDRKAHQLEERDRELKKQDAFYREQVAKLEERSAKFYRVTTENYHKAADEVNAKFKRYEIKPICADLQGQILKCYRENTGQTLSCSRIASLYLQCVNDAKQNKMRTGG